MSSLSRSTATSRSSRIDGDGRIILPEGLRTHAGLQIQVTFVGLGDKFQMWEPRAFEERRERAREKFTRHASSTVLQQAPVAAPVMRRGRQGQIHDGRARHIPVLLSEVIESLDPQDGETYIDGTFGAGGYTRAILEAAFTHVMRHRSRSGCHPRAVPLMAEFGERFLFRPGFSGISWPSPPGRLGIGGRRRPRYRRLLDPDRRGRTRLLVPERRPARHANVASAKAPPTSSTPMPRNSSPTSSISSARTKSRAIARAIVRQRNEQPFAQHVELAQCVLARLPRSQDRWPPSGHPHVPGVAHPRQR